MFWLVFNINLASSITKKYKIWREGNLGQYAIASVYYRKDDIYVQGISGKHLLVIDLIMDDDQLNTEGLLQIQDGRR